MRTINVAIFFLYAMGFLMACNSPGKRSRAQFNYCDTGLQFLRHSSLFFSEQYDLTSQTDSNSFDFTVTAADDTLIDFTSYETNLLFLDTANILQYAQYDPTYATAKDILAFKKSNRKEGEARKKEMAAHASRYIFIKNRTSSKIKFINTEFNLVAIIEVETPERKWVPIQYFQPYPDKERVYDVKFELKPNQAFIALDTVNYYGDVTAKAHYKFLTDKGFLYSSEFAIKVNECQQRGFSKRVLDSLSQKRIYFLDTFISPPGVR